MKSTHVALVAAVAAASWSRPADACHWVKGDPIEQCLHAGGDILSCVCQNGGPCEGAMFTLACGDDCPHMDVDDFEEDSNNPDLVAYFYDSKGKLLFTESAAFVLQSDKDTLPGEIRFTALGNLSRVEFDAAYRDPKTTILNRADLKIKLEKVDAKGRVLDSITGWNVSYSHALWAEHCGDTAVVEGELDELKNDIKAHELLDNQRFADEAAARKQGDIDALAAANAYTDAIKIAIDVQIQAEIAARSAADALLNAALNAEIAARKAADILLDAQLQGEAAARIAGDNALSLALSAEIANRKQGDLDVLAAANAYTDARTPWPQSCPNAGDEIVWDGVKWVCEADKMPVCPAGDSTTRYYLESAGNGDYVCRAFCSGVFVDAQNDKNNCGTCGNFCVNTFEVNDTNCQAGACVVSSCSMGFLDCNGQYADGCECFIANGTPKCGMGGACDVATCNAGFANCNGNGADGCEVDLNTDNANCGACGNACPMGQTCGGGVCQAFFNWQGVVLNQPKNKFTGWSVCFEQPYGTFGPSLGQIQAQCPGAKIAYACAPNNSTDYQVAAWAPRADVFQVTPDCSNQTHLANGAYWYFNNSCSMGVSPIPQISQNSADTQDAPGFANNFNSGDSRISWHTGGGQINGGWRCGNTTFLNGEPSGFTRYVLQAM